MTADELVTKADIENLKKEMFAFIKKTIDGAAKPRNRALPLVEARKRLGDMADSSIRELMRNGDLAYSKPGKQILVLENDIDDLLQKTRHGTNDEVLSKASRI